MWQAALQPATALFAAGMIGLGVLALVYGDFALVWQPVAPWVPGRTALAYASGVIMLLGGVGLLFRATAAWSARVAVPVSDRVGAAQGAGARRGSARSKAYGWGLANWRCCWPAGWVLFARLGGVREDSWLAFARGERGIRIAKYLFAIWIIPVGLSHFFYVKPTIRTDSGMDAGAHVLGISDGSRAHCGGTGRAVFRCAAGWRCLPRRAC